MEFIIVFKVISCYPHLFTCTFSSLGHTCIICFVFVVVFSTSESVGRGKAGSSSMSDSSPESFPSMKRTCAADRDILQVQCACRLHAYH